MPNSDDPCGRIAKEIESLKADKKALQKDLQTAVGGEKTAIVQQINKLNKLIAQKEKQLKNCNPLQDSNKLTKRVGKILLEGTDGEVGLYLKKVNGPILAKFHEQMVFEPASTIKVILHFHAIRQIQANPMLFLAQVSWYTNYILDNAGKPTSCPADTGPAISGLLYLLGEMMQKSDNRATQAIREYFGEQNINNTAHSIGMNSTSYNHRDGCAGGADGAIADPNTMTLQNAGLLYEGVANGSLLTFDMRYNFYLLMAGKYYDFTSVWKDINKIVDEEAPSGMNDAKKQSFLSETDTRYKAGGYSLAGLEYRSIAGWAKIPFRIKGDLSHKQYVFGIFIAKATNSTKANNTFNSAKTELLREEIHNALKTW